MNCYGTDNDTVIILMTMKFYHMFRSKRKSGKPVGQSFMTVAASKVGLDVVEVG